MSEVTWREKANEFRVEFFLETKKNFMRGVPTSRGIRKMLIDITFEIDNITYIK